MDALLGVIIILVSEINENNITDEIADKLLFDGLEYKGEEADVTIVLGSSKACFYRVPVAAEIYHSGKSGKFIFCGEKRQNTKYGFMPEYAAMLIEAKKLGIPVENIIAETTSVSTVENLENAKELIDGVGGCKSVILITTAYHMRRALKIAENILSGYKIISCPANDRSSRRDNWSKTDKGRKIVLDECLKFGYYIKNKYIEDFNI